MKTIETWSKALRQCGVCKQTNSKVKLSATFLPYREQLRMEWEQELLPAQLLHLWWWSLLGTESSGQNPAQALVLQSVLWVVAWEEAPETIKFPFCLWSFHQDPSGIPREVQAGHMKDWMQVQKLLLSVTMFWWFQCGPWAVPKGVRKIIQKSKAVGSRLANVLNIVSLYCRDPEIRHAKVTKSLLEK